MKQTKVDSDAIFDTVGKGIGTVATTPNGKGALVRGDDLHDGRGILGGLRKNDTPGRLLGAERPNRADALLEDGRVSHMDFVLKGTRAGEGATLRRMLVGAQRMEIEGDGEKAV